MYIEFFGFPASGKTTLVNKIKQLDDTVETRRNLDKKKILVLLNFPLIFFLKMLYFSIKNSFFSKNFLKSLIIKYYFYNQFKDRTYVSDHGFIQVLLSEPILMKKIIMEPLLLKEYLSLLPSGRYVLLNTSLQESVLREKNRKKFVGMGNKKMQDLYNLIEEIIMILKSSNFKISLFDKDEPIGEILQ